MNALTVNAQGWQMKKAPMMTPWSETIDVHNVLPEYPRPQMIRKEWMNLGFTKRCKRRKLRSEFYFRSKNISSFPDRIRSFRNYGRK